MPDKTSKCYRVGEFVSGGAGAIFHGFYGFLPVHAKKF